MKRTNKMNNRKTILWHIFGFISFAFGLMVVSNNLNSQIQNIPYFPTNEKSILDTIEQELNQCRNKELKPIIIMEISKLQKFEFEELPMSLLQKYANGELSINDLYKYKAENFEPPVNQLYTEYQSFIIPLSIKLDSVGGDLWELASTGNRVMVCDTLTFPLLFDFEKDVNPNVFKRIFVE